LEVEVTRADCSSWLLEGRNVYAVETPPSFGHQSSAWIATEYVIRLYRTREVARRQTTSK